MSSTYTTTSITTTASINRNKKEMHINVPPIPSHIFLEGGAWGCAFHVGVYKALQEMYGLDALKDVVFGGNSGGASLACCMASGIGWEKAEQLYLSMLKNVLKDIFPRFSLYQNNSISAVFDNDPNFYKKVNNKLNIGVTYFVDEYELISKWESNEELRNTLHASMHIPFYCSVTEKIKSNDGIYRRAIDGGCGKHFHRFNENTLVIGILSSCSDIKPNKLKLEIFGNLAIPDLKTFYLLKQHGYDTMINWDGKYKWKQYNQMRKVKYGRKLKGRAYGKWKKPLIILWWILRLSEEIKIGKLISIFVIIFQIRRWLINRSLQRIRKCNRFIMLSA